MKIFISYSSKDRPLIEGLADDLDFLGHEVWFDRELNRSGGHPWWKTICAEIRKCEAFIYALSTHVINSVPCQREYEYARKLGKPVLPLIIAEIDYRYLPRDLQEAQLINFRDHTAEQRRALRDSLRNLPPCPELPANALELEPEVPLDPVGVLIDRIRTLTSDADQQKLLIIDIDDLEEDGKYAAQVPELFRLLIARDDVLTVRNLKRAQELLSKVKAPDKPTAPPVKVVTPSRPRVMPLPPPFAWIPIPAGKVTLITEKGWAKNYIPEGKTQTFDVPAFEIGKYPVTNAQFAEFIKAGGYTQDRWWTPEGIKTRNGNSWAEPRYWRDPKWNPADHPVVGVSWYEAIAFCRWLSEVTGETITLPTEQQWQRAAQGDTNRVYPWGDTFDASRCNTKEANIGKTTPVTAYEGKGDSPFGVVDLSGNVWEWCLTVYETGSNDLSVPGEARRVLRGGSWFNDDFNARAASRFNRLPVNGDGSRGFRLALSVPV